MRGTDGYYKRNSSFSAEAFFRCTRAREGCCGNLEFYLLWPSFHAAEEKRRLEIDFLEVMEVQCAVGYIGILLRQGDGSWVFILGAEVFLLLLYFELLCCEFYSNLRKRNERIL